MDKKSRTISWLDILIFLSCLTTIILSILIFLSTQENSDGIYASMNQLQEENQKQFDRICVDVRELHFAVNDFSEDNRNRIDLLSDNIRDLSRQSLDNHRITNRLITETGAGINRSFQEFIKAGNREVDSASSGKTASLDNERILEKAFNEGMLFYREKKFSESLDIFFDALSLYPQDREIRFYYLSALYYSDPENENNFKHLKEQLRLFTYDILYAEKSLKILAEISLSEDDMESALKLFCILYEEDETDPSYLRSIAMIEYQLSHFEEAAQHFISYLYSNSQDYEIIYFYGLSLYNLALYEEALSQFYLVQKSDHEYGNLNRKIDETLTKMENS